MTIIDKSKPVLVTGATGFVAAWIIKRLLDEGLIVHGTVRNLEKTEKFQHLLKLAENSKGKIKFFEADLLKEGSFKNAIENCELVFHTASPFFTAVKNPQKELVEPAVNGTTNVLNEATNCGTVKKIVLTSSVAAIYSDVIDCQNAPNGILTEKIWNTTSSIDYQPYSYSKTLAEKKAWEISESQNKWDLVTINPSFVMGPALNPKESNSESLSILKQMGDGSFKMGAPKMGVGIVDVRDVAEAHYQAGFNPEAKGRYITSGHNTDFVEIGKVLNVKYGNSFPVPKRELPKWLLMLVGPFANKLFTRKFIRNNVNVVFNADNSKIKKELGLKFRSLDETMNDAFQVLIDEGILKSK
jgi:nucleoside-diphosphate-sugar epimerase